VNLAAQRASPEPALVESSSPKTSASWARAGPAGNAVS